MSTVTEHLDRLYCQHVVSGMWAQAVYFRLEGLPQVVLQDVLRQVAEDHRRTAVELGERLGDLDGEPTADPALIVANSVDGAFALPEDCGSFRQILERAATSLTATVGAYRAAIADAGDDRATENLLVKHLAAQERNLADARAAGRG